MNEKKKVGRKPLHTDENQKKIAAAVEAGGLTAAIEVLATEGIHVPIETARRYAEKHGVTARLAGRAAAGAESSDEEEKRLQEQLREALAGTIEQREEALTQILLHQILRNRPTTSTRQALTQIARMREHSEKRAERERAEKAAHGSRIVTLVLPPRDPDD